MHLYENLQSLIVGPGHQREREARALLPAMSTQSCIERITSRHRCHANLNEARQRKPELLVHHKICATCLLGLLRLASVEARSRGPAYIEIAGAEHKVDKEPAKQPV